MEVSKTCKNCGRKFIGQPRSLYCPECKTVLEREMRGSNTAKRRLFREMKAIREKSCLAENERAAREAGMTYGQYMGKRRMSLA